MILAQLALWLAPMQDAGALSERAQSLAIEKRFDEAEALWRQAIVRSPDFFPALFNLGYMYYSTGRFDQAAAWLAKAGRVSPQDFNARYLLGAALVKLEKREEALKEWRAALEHLLADPGLRARMGAKGRERALADYSLAVHAPRVVEVILSASRR